MRKALWDKYMKTNNLDSMIVLTAFTGLFRQFGCCYYRYSELSYIMYFMYLLVGANIDKHGSFI